MLRLRVRAYRDTFIKVSDRQLTAIGDGIRASGDEFAFTNNLHEEADVALVVSGAKFPGSRIGNAREEIHKRFVGRMVTCETALFRRGAQPHEGPDPYFRLSVGGFMRDDAQFHPRGFEPTIDRWCLIRDEQGLDLRRCNRAGRGRYVLVCMQKPSDASLRGLSVHDWTLEMVKKIKDFTSAPIVLRPHPLDSTRAGVDIRNLDCFWSRHKELQDDLEDARAVVTYTSLSAIESIMDGTPTFCLSPGNHAWPVSLKDNLERLKFMYPTKKTPWLDDWVAGLAWSQWKLSELREGGPWRRLRPMLI